MRAGSLRQQLTIRTRSTANSGYGTTGTATVTDVATVWGSVEPQRSSESQASQQRGYTRDYLVRVRYSADISLSEANEIGFGSRTLEVIGLRNIDERNREWEIECREHVT